MDTGMDANQFRCCHCQDVGEATALLILRYRWKQIPDSPVSEVARRNYIVCVERVLESIRTQLEWLVSYFEDRNDERAKLHTLVFGHYAARELDERDAVFIHALGQANYVASRTAAGLTIDLKVLGYDS
jgi:Tsi6